MATTYSEFESDLANAVQTWSVDLGSLNNSGASGTAILALMPENEDGEQYLSISISASGLESNVQVVQHIHGRFDEDGDPVDSVTPTNFADSDRDGYVEVIEGVPDYGDVLLPLTDGEGNFGSTDEDGNFSFIASYDVNDGDLFGSPVTGADYDGADIFPLMLREIVLHGVTVPDGVGEGTDGEVDGGDGGFTQILPATAGEIEEISKADAMALLDQQRAVGGETVAGTSDYEGTDADDSIVGTAGDDTLDGGAGDDAIRGLDGDDLLSGGTGDDVVDGDLGDDVIDESDDEGNSLNLASLGASGALSLSDYDNGYAGGGGDDTILGGAGDDIITGDDDSRVSAATDGDFDAGADGSDVI